MDKPTILPILPSKIQTYYDRCYSDPAIHFDPNLSLTDQDFKLQTDVNYLLAHMAGHSRTPIYGEQDNRTFEDWSNEMALVKRRFMNLTPDQRARFGNAQNFLNWCADPNNYIDELHTVKEDKRFKENKEREENKRVEQENAFAKKIADAINNKE